MKLRYITISGVLISISLICISSYLYAYMSAYFNFFLPGKNSVSVPQNPEILEAIMKLPGLLGLHPEQAITLLVAAVAVMLCFLVGIYLYLTIKSPRALLNEKR